MSSLKMTFSLASLVLIFAFAFSSRLRWQRMVVRRLALPSILVKCWIPMVQPQAADYKATRADFKVKLTFSHGVAAPTASDIDYQAGNADGFVDYCWLPLAM